MKFKEKYVSEAEKLKEGNKEKLILSNDAYAIGEMIESLINKIEHARLSMFTKK